TKSTFETAVRGRRKTRRRTPSAPACRRRLRSRRRRRSWRRRPPPRRRSSSSRRTTNSTSLPTRTGTRPPRTARTKSCGRTTGTTTTSTTTSAGTSGKSSPRTRRPSRSDHNRPAPLSTSPSRNKKNLFVALEPHFDVAGRRHQTTRPASTSLRLNIDPAPSP
ncbi:hypothetical protein M885DRAFT_622764, partial [Pelagophyceae sp. CCMP2097]